MQYSSSRRNFLENLIYVSIGSQILPRLSPLSSKNDIDWNKIGDQFLAKQSSTINLNNGSASNMPIPVLEAYKKYTEEINSFAPYKIYAKWGNQIKENIKRLSHFLGASDGKMFMVRNATEAMNMIFWGMDFKKGDEIICANSDYPNAHNTLIHLVYNKKVKIKKANINIPTDTDEEIIEKYKKLISKKTKLILLTHITHREGHIFPIKALTKIGKEAGIKVMVDAAHSIGHVDHNISEIGCDYYASSLHKWFNAPLGTGLLFIKNKSIDAITPPLSYPISKLSDPERFKYLGTHAYQNYMAIKDCLDFLELTGIQAKQERFNYLKNYWVSQLKGDKKIKMTTDPLRSGVIASFEPDVRSKKILKNKLLQNHNVHVKTSSYGPKVYLRVSPNLYTTENQLDHFVNALRKEVYS